MAYTRDACVYYAWTNIPEKLLEQDKSVTTHTSNLPIVAMEMFKVFEIYLPPFSVRFLNDAM